MKTRLKALWQLISISAILLAACGSAATATQSSTQSLSLASELAVGILKLEDTDQAVSGTQASSLLTLWQAYQVLSVEETTAQAELEALLLQVQDALSEAQWQAIQAMQLNSQSVLEMTQSLESDFSIESGSDFLGITSSEQNPIDGPMGMQGAPGGMPADDIGMLMGGAGMELGAQSTPADSAKASASERQLSIVMLNALISLLETKAATL